MVQFFMPQGVVVCCLLDCWTCFNVSIYAAVLLLKSLAQFATSDVM